MKGLGLVIPVLNEAQNIERLLERLGAHILAPNYKSIVVVDDGSTDGTGEIAKSFADRLPIKVVRHATNLGVGEAFRSGFSAVLSELTTGDVVVTMEGDNTSDPAVLSLLVEAVSSRQADFALASCYAPGGRIDGTNLLRIVLSKGANLLLRLAFPDLKVHTFSSFYRAYTPEILLRIRERTSGAYFREDGFACMVELLIRLFQESPRVVEVPMVLKMAERQGKSKMKILNTIRAYVRLIARRNELLSQAKTL